MKLDAPQVWTGRRRVRARQPPRPFGSPPPASLPAQPWLADYPWTLDGDVDLPARRLATPSERSILGGALAILAPATLVALAWGDVSRYALYTLALLDGCWLLVVAGFLEAYSRQKGLGPARLRYDSFPYHPGETLAATLVAGPALAEADTLTVTLRFVQVSAEYAKGSVRQGGGSQRMSTSKVATVPYSTLEATWELPFSGTIVGDEVHVPLRLPLPPKAPPSELSGRPPVYWELVVEASCGGRDFEASFLVPVYARPIVA